MSHPIQAHAAASPSPQTSLLPFDSGPELESAAFENGVQAVLGLTRGQREILKDAVRLNVAGLTNREVARVIGCCLSNVQRALKAVRP